MATESPAQSQDFVRSADGTKLAYWHWPVAGSSTTFAVVHGLGEHGGRYDRFAHGMAPFGMSTYALDLRGHGRSAGQRGHVDSWTQLVEDASAFIAWVQNQTPHEVVPVGHSFGGAVLLSTVLARKLANTRRFVVSSPALKLKMSVPGWKKSLGRLTARVTPRLAMSNNVDPGTVSRLPEVVEAYRKDPLVHNRITSRMFSEWQGASAEILARAGEIEIPFLILAGSDDRLIDPEGSRLLHERTPRVSRFELLPGRYHEPFNDLGSDQVFALIADWMKR
ncbi:MAG TPA: lysophospholipase [Candidatus Dormibacteraeota bacterium]|nr:lysophospholipase [Candidatus Dormibacteraeota bacterium]